MPYVELPQRNMRVYYACNIKIRHTEEFTEDWDPESHPIDPTKPTVVFIHGPTSVAQAFTAQFADARLVQQYNLIAFDVRHHGKTECTAPKQDASTMDLAEDLIAAMDALGLTEVSMVGEGFLGSNLCTWTAIKRPNQVKALFLVSPGFLDEPVAVGDMMFNEWLPMALANKNGAGDGTGSLPDVPLDIVNSFFFGTVSREGGRRQAYREHFQSRYGTGKDDYDLSRLITFFRRKPIPLELRQAVSAPVLIIQGGDDVQVSPLHAAEEWKDGFTSTRGGADVRVITGAPHLLCLTDYSIANRFLLAFLQRSLNG